MIFRERTGGVCVHDGKLLICRFCDPTTQKVMAVVPGGGIHEGESPAECTVRELLEETGYSVRISGEAFVNEYDFDWDGEMYHCLTHWFRVELIDPDAEPVRVDDAAYNWGPGWLPVADIPTAFSYNVRVLDAVTRLVSG